MNIPVRMYPLVILVTATLLAAATVPAVADGKRKPTPADPAWQEECGSCHIAYPPRLLPAGSWQRLMQGLGDHFGSDASLEPQRAAAIEAFLVANAGRSKDGVTAPPLRITETPWFRGEHDEVATAKWRSPAIGSPANCGACHTQAERGSFDEDEIRIP